MNWTALIVAAIPTVGVALTAFVTTRQLRLSRDVEMSKLFASFAAFAHGRPTDGRDGVGVGEQVAYLHLMASLAMRYRLLRHAGEASLAEFAAWDTSDSPSDEQKAIALTARAALARLTK